MKFLEKDLEQIIFESDKSQLAERGLGITGTIKRQLRIGNYGVADLIEFKRGYDSLYVTIYELKQHEVNIHTLMQAIRYARGITDYIKNSRNKKFKVYCRFVLIGSSVSDSDFMYIPDLLGQVQVYTYSYKFSGIYFNPLGSYTLKNNGFNG